MSGPGGAPPAVLGVDGGNSKTAVVLVDAEGNLRGQARGPGSNHQLLGLDVALQNLAGTIEAARADAGLDPGAGPVVPVGAYCLAGLDLPVDQRRLADAIAGRHWSEVDVLRNDTMAVSRAGVTAGWGIGVVCGTGINCAGLGPDGRTVRYPSLGELSGDFAHGGGWLGVRALGLALRAGDGRGPQTALRSLVAAHFDMADPESVLEGVYTGAVPHGRLFELAEVALAAAADGDGPARLAVDELADEVVALATATIRRLGVEQTAVEVVLGGGIFDSGDPGFRRRVEQGVRSVAPDAQLRTLGAPPVLGAALLGLDALGASPAAEQRLRRALADGD